MFMHNVQIQKTLQTALTFQILIPKFIRTSELVLEGWKVFLEFLIFFFFVHYFQLTNIWKFDPKLDLRILFVDGVTCCSRANWQRMNNQMRQTKRKLWSSREKVEKIFFKLMEKLQKSKKITLKDRSQARS